MTRHLRLAIRTWWRRLRGRCVFCARQASCSTCWHREDVCHVCAKFWNGSSMYGMQGSKMMRGAR